MVYNGARRPVAGPQPFPQPMFMKKTIITVAAIAATIVQAVSQNISYGQYMEQVLTNNIALTAQRLNIDIATARTKASKVYNDPTLAITYSNSEDREKELGYAIEGELSRTFTFGVRKGGIRVAQSEQTETAALLEEYLRNFRADATIAYLAHIKANMRLAIKAENENNLQRVAHNDSIRYTRGDIAKSDWLESRLAAVLAHNNRLAAEAEVKSSAIELGYYMGNLQNAENIKGSGTLEINEPTAPMDNYIERAIANRADLQAALCRVDVAEATRKFNAAQRRTDLNVKIAAEYNRSARIDGEREPSVTVVKAGVAIPLKFSNLNKGARTTDKLLVQQAQQEAEDARLFVQSQVMQAYNEYLYATMQTTAFTPQMVQEVNNTVNSKRRAYEAGDIPFLDYISAEQRKNEMNDAYVDALFNKALKWVELQRATGCGMEFSTQAIAE